MLNILGRNEAAKSSQRTISDPFSLTPPIQFFDGFFFFRLGVVAGLREAPPMQRGWSIGGVRRVWDGTKHGLRAAAGLSGGRATESWSSGQQPAENVRGLQAASRSALAWL